MLPLKGLVRHNSGPLSFVAQRSNVEAHLESMGGNHLVVVRYLPEHCYHWEWVYNQPDIDHARIVWAREMGGEQDRRLLSYFHDRQRWLIEIGESVQSMTKYPESELQ
jgi:hypothetical protein